MEVGTVIYQQQQNLWKSINWFCIRKTKISGFLISEKPLEHKPSSFRQKQSSSFLKFSYSLQNRRVTLSPRVAFRQYDCSFAKIYYGYQLAVISNIKLSMTKNLKINTLVSGMIWKQSSTIFSLYEIKHFTFYLMTKTSISCVDPIQSY